MRFQPDYKVAPGKTVLEFMEERGWSLELVSAQLRLTLADLQSLLFGDLPITQELASSLEELTQVSAEFWMRLEANYRR